MTARVFQRYMVFVQEDYDGACGSNGCVASFDTEAEAREFAQQYTTTHRNCCAEVFDRLAGVSLNPTRLWRGGVDS